MSAQLFQIRAGLGFGKAIAQLTGEVAGGLVLAVKKPKKNPLEALGIVAGAFLVVATIFYWVIAKMAVAFSNEIKTMTDVSWWHPVLATILLLGSVCLIIWCTYRRYYYNGTGVITVFDGGTEENKIGYWGFELEGLTRSGSFTVPVPVNNIKTKQGTYGAPEVTASVPLTFTVERPIDLLGADAAKLSTLVLTTTDAALKPVLEKYTVEQLAAGLQANTVAGALEQVREALDQQPISFEGTGGISFTIPTAVKQKIDADAAEQERIRKEAERAEQERKALIAKLQKLTKAAKTPELALAAVNAVDANAEAVGDDADGLKTDAVNTLAQSFRRVFESQATTPAVLDGVMRLLSQCAQYFTDEVNAELDAAGAAAQATVQQRADEALQLQGRVGADEARRGAAVVMELGRSSSVLTKLCSCRVVSVPMRLVAAPRWSWSSSTPTIPSRSSSPAPSSPTRTGFGPRWCRSASRTSAVW